VNIHVNRHCYSALESEVPVPITNSRIVLLNLTNAEMVRFARNQWVMFSRHLTSECTLPIDHAFRRMAVSLSVVIHRCSQRFGSNLIPENCRPKTGGHEIVRLRHCPQPFQTSPPAGAAVARARETLARGNPNAFRWLPLRNSRPGRSNPISSTSRTNTTTNTNTNTRPHSRANRGGVPQHQIQPRPLQHSQDHLSPRAFHTRPVLGQQTL
jgi:hypothetical protein